MSKSTTRFRPDFFCFGASRLYNDSLTIDTLVIFQTNVGFRSKTEWNFNTPFRPEDLINLSLKIKPFFNFNDRQMNLNSCRDFIKLKKGKRLRNCITKAFQSHDRLNDQLSGKIPILPHGNHLIVESMTDRIFGTILNGLIFHFDSEKIGRLSELRRKFGENALALKLQEYAILLHAFCELIWNYNAILRKLLPQKHIQTPDVKTLTLMHFWEANPKELFYANRAAGS